MEPQRTNLLLDDPIPRPLPVENITCDLSKFYGHYSDSCFPIEDRHPTVYSISGVFGRALAPACPLARRHSEIGDTLCLEDYDTQKAHVKTAGEYVSRNVSAYKTCYTLPGE